LKTKNTQWSKTPAVQEARVVKLSVAIHVNYRFFGREQYTKPGGIIAYLLTDGASVGGIIA
jgi:hypothetical protein